MTGRKEMSFTTPPSVTVNREFSLVAYIGDPKEGMNATITLPPGFELVDTPATQPVSAKTQPSPVTWKIRACPTAGTFRFTVDVKINNEAGFSGTHPVIVNSKSIF